MNTITPTPLKSDSEFCQEIIDLIDGTHWTKGSLETSCKIPVFSKESAPKNVELTDEYVTYNKRARMRWRTEYQEWKLTPPSRRESNPPNRSEYDAEDIFVVNQNQLRNYRRNPMYAEPIKVGTYYKSKWCLIGLVLKVAALPPTSESPLYMIDVNNGGMPNEDVRNVDHKQPWRIIDALVGEITNRVKMKSPKRLPASEVIVRVEGWNDDEDTTREDVRDVVVKTRDHFRRVGSGEAS